MTPSFQDVMNVRLKNHADRLVSDMTVPSPLWTILHRDVRTLTRRERIARRVGIYWGRIRDAWLVLIGREQIGDGY